MGSLILTTRHCAAPGAVMTIMARIYCHVDTTWVVRILVIVMYLYTTYIHFSTKSSTVKKPILRILNHIESFGKIMRTLSIYSQDGGWWDKLAGEQMPCWHLPPDFDRLQGPQPRGGRPGQSSFQVLSATQSYGLLPLLSDGKPAESGGEGRHHHRIKQRRGLLVEPSLPGPAWPRGSLQGARQLSLSGLCGAAEGQKRDI